MEGDGDSNPNNLKTDNTVSQPIGDDSNDNNIEPDNNDTPDPEPLAASANLDAAQHRQIVRQRDRGFDLFDTPLSPVPYEDRSVLGKLGGKVRVQLGRFRRYGHSSEPLELSDQFEQNSELQIGGVAQSSPYIPGFIPVILKAVPEHSGFSIPQRRGMSVAGANTINSDAYRQSGASKTHGTN